MPKAVLDEKQIMNDAEKQAESKAQTFEMYDGHAKSDKQKAEATEFGSAKPKVDKSQKQLKDEKSKEPISLPREYFTDDLNYDSLVEFKENNDIIRGMIRWMGHTGDPKKVIVGVEVVRIHSCDIICSPVGSLCHNPGVFRRRSSIVRRVSSVSTITTRNN